MGEWEGAVRGDSGLPSLPALEEREVVDGTREVRANCRKDEALGLEHTEPDAVGQAETAPALETQALSSVERPDLVYFPSTLSCPFQTGDTQRIRTVVSSSLASPLAFRVEPEGIS